MLETRVLSDIQTSKDVPISLVQGQISLRPSAGSHIDIERSEVIHSYCCERVDNPVTV